MKVTSIALTLAAVCVALLCTDQRPIAGAPREQTPKSGVKVVYTPTGELTSANITNSRGLAVALCSPSSKISKEILFKLPPETRDNVLQAAISRDRDLTKDDKQIIVRVLN